MDDQETFERLKNLYIRQLKDELNLVSKCDNIDDLACIVFGQGEVSIKMFSVLKKHVQNRTKVYQVCTRLNQRLED